MIQFRIIKLDAISSTNDYLKSRVASGLCHSGDVVIASHQTAGRGQREREWVSDQGKNLTFSVYWQTPGFWAKDQFLITVAVSVALLQILEAFNIPDIQIKWPNDIMAGNFKIGGILIENTLHGPYVEHSIIGIGINVNQENFPDIPHASSLKLHMGCEMDVDVLFEKCLQVLKSTLETPHTWQQDSLLSSYNEHLFGKQKGLRLQLDGEQIDVQIRRVDPDGVPQLVLQTGEPLFLSGKQYKFVY